MEDSGHRTAVCTAAAHDEPVLQLHLSVAKGPRAGAARDLFPASAPLLAVRQDMGAAGGQISVPVLQVRSLFQE